jgi:hypothetical protein
MRAAYARWVRLLVAMCPPGQGLHWSSPIETSIRAIHLLAAFHLLGGASAFDDETRERLGCLLLLHGRSVAGALENTGVVEGNHLVANWVGLLWLGASLGVPDWQRRARRELGRQMQRQVYPDGAGFEGSTAYHRFVLELFVAAAVLCRAANLPMEAPFWARLRRMFYFVRGYLTPAGRDPGIGDADDGRVLPLGDRDPLDHAYLLSIGAVLFGDPGLRPEGSQFSEEALWLGGARGYRAWRRLAPTAPAASEAFPHGGLYVMRSGEDYLAVRCGAAGQDGVGGHSHNDQLAVVACAGGRPMVVDSGTGSYSLDALFRDHFRGTAAHATVVIDGEEQSPIPERPFALPDQAHARAVLWRPGPASDRFIGEHRGYARLRSRVMHRREITFDKVARVFLLTDLLAGAGWHDVEICLPLPSPEARAGLGVVAATRLAELTRAAGWARGGFEVDLAVEIGPLDDPVAVIAPFANQGLRLELRRALRSPRYGEVQATRSARYSLRTSLPCVVTVALVALAAGGGAIP